MYELLLITLISAPPENTAIESQAIETHLSIDDCLSKKERFIPRPIQLPTGQRLTIKLACEKMEVKL